MNLKALQDFHASSAASHSTAQNVIAAMIAAGAESLPASFALFPDVPSAPAAASGVADAPKIAAPASHPDNWREVIESKFADGTYERLPFADHPAFKARDAALGHFAHRSTNDSNRVAYTKSEQRGREGRVTVSNIDRYLARHYPSLDRSTRSTWIGAMAG